MCADSRCTRPCGICLDPLSRARHTRPCYSIRPEYRLPPRGGRHQMGSVRPSKRASAVPAARSRCLRYTSQRGVTSCFSGLGRFARSASLSRCVRSHYAFRCPAARRSAAVRAGLLYWLFVGAQGRLYHGSGTRARCPRGCGAGFQTAGSLCGVQRASRPSRAHLSHASP